MAAPAGYGRPPLENKQTQPAASGLRLWLYGGMVTGFLIALALRLWPGAQQLLPELPFSLACPVHRLTGWLCMGCGATRALGSLLTGHPGAALRQNLLFVVLLAVLLWQGLARRLHLFPILRPGRRTGWILLALALVFMVLRNLDLPLAAFLRP